MRTTNCPRCGQMRLDGVIHICLKVISQQSGSMAAARADSLVTTGGDAKAGLGNIFTAAQIGEMQDKAEARGRDRAFAEIERALLDTEPLDPNHHTAKVLADHDEKIRSEAYAKGYTDGSRDYDR